MTVTDRGETRTASGRPGVDGAPAPWWRQRSRLLDLLAALLVFAYNLPTMPGSAPGLLDDPARYLALALLSLLMCAAHLLRPRFPLGVLGVMLAAACLQLPLGAPVIMADAMLLFSVYNVATRCTWRISLPAALVVVGWLLVAVVPNLSDDFLDVGQLGVLIVVTLWVWTWGTLVRVRRDYIAGLRDRAEHLEREREDRERIAVADERARIAREIHDIVSHSLSVVVVMSDGAASKVDSEPERARSAMLQVRDTGRGALAEMRRMLGVLRADEPGSHTPQPGMAALDRLIEESRRAGLPVSFTVSGEETEVPEGVGSTVFRIAQEALTNARKHAGPRVTRVDVGLEYRAGEVEVRVRDDGAGDAGPAGAAAEGHGLLGMRERVAAHGGTIDVGPGPRGGFSVVVVLPIGEAS